MTEWHSFLPTTTVPGSGWIGQGRGLELSRSCYEVTEERVPAFHDAVLPDRLLRFVNCVSTHLRTSPCFEPVFHDARGRAETEECVPMSLLTAGELSEFQLIVENAHREGWINAAASLAAEHSGSSVKVTASQGSNVVQKTYPHDPRWTFRLLRDLAWGSYRTWATSR